MKRLTGLAVLFCSLAASVAVGGTLHIDYYGDHEYRLLAPALDGSKWWNEAQAEAVAADGNLVTVNNAAENAWLVDTFGPIARTFAAENELAGSVLLWLGFNDVETEGSYVWVSGEASDYTNWAPGQPGGTLDDEDYAAIIIDYPGRSFEPGTWHDVVSDYRFQNVVFGVIEIASNSDPNGDVPEPASCALLAIAMLLLSCGRGARIAACD